MPQNLPAVTLRNLIFMLTITAALSTLVASLTVAYHTYREAVIRSSLEGNEAYARKISEALNGVLQDSFARLRYSAQMIGKGGDLNHEMDRLLHQDSTFNSIVVADVHGRISNSLPYSERLTGKVLLTWQPVLNETEHTSSAFLSLMGNLIVYISVPVRSSDEDKAGVLVATIHLKADNFFYRLLSEHSFINGASLYLIDGKGNYLYQPNDISLSRRVEKDTVLQALLHREGGSVVVKNSAGDEALLSYASVPNTAWGVILEQPLQVADDMMKNLFQSIAWGILPLGLAGVFFTAWGASRISRPLRQLADGAKQLGEEKSILLIKETNGWYLEASRLRRALLTGISLVDQKLSILNDQAYRDPLTNLANRRGLVEILSRLEQESEGFSIIAVDIDRFKMVNDTFGHDVGDMVLRRLAQVLENQTRKGDVVFRVGGEEFVVVLPHRPIYAAAALAERIRSAVEKTSMSPCTPVTISLGVASWCKDYDRNFSDTLKKADELLYMAKKSGRNRVQTQSKDLENLY